MTTVTTPLGGPTLPQIRHLATEVPGPRSRELLARKSSAVAASVATAMPIYVAAAGGGVLVDVDGNSLVDLASGIAVTGLGNAHPELVAAISAQAQLFTHTCFTVSGYEGYVAVAEALNQLTPGDFAKRSALFNSGAEAVENAVKVARSFTGRQAVVAFDHAYHGRTNLTMALTAKSMPYKSGFGPFAPEVYRAPLSYPFRDGGMDGAAAARRAIAQIEAQIGVRHLAALILEPIQGEGGFIVPAPGFWTELSAWAQAHDVVFIADEIQSGFGRTGRMFACEHEGVVPDLVVTAKGIAGGMPLSAVTGRAEIMDAPQPGGLGGTYAGNPMACAAALAAIDIYQQGDLIERVREIETLMLRRLRTLQAGDPRIGDVRGRGAMIAIELVASGTSEPDPGLTKQIATYALEHGVVLLTCGTYGNVIRFLPPFTIVDDLLHDGLDVVAEALAAG